MRERREPVFLDSADDGGLGRQRGHGEVHVRIHGRRSEVSSSHRRFWVWIVSTLLSIVLIFGVVRWMQLQVVDTTIDRAARTSALINEQARRAAEESRQRIEREKAERATAQRKAIEAENARIAAALEQEQRRERAWNRFYRPSEFCASPDNRATMQCANEYARAKKEFDRRWAAGELP
ncbi:hypothetical protein FBR04_12510 [Betaproteobacteria bacterium PRO7]|nr:hypothetical protein [Betaproteobacteria bacterium PRO7]